MCNQADGSRKGVRCLVVCMGLMIMSGLVPMVHAAGNDDPSARQIIADLQAEQQHLGGELRRVKKVKQDIDRMGSELDGAAYALKRAKQELQRKGAQIAIEGHGIDEQAQQSGCAWGTKSTDIAYVNSCNALRDKLMGLQQDLRNRVISLEEYAAKLLQEENHLSEATFKWGKKKKANNADLEELTAELSKWQQRYNAVVFQSDTYERLKRIAPGARLCEQLSEHATDQDLQNAAQCLQRLWEGTR